MNINLNAGSDTANNTITGFIKADGIFNPVNIDVTTLSPEDQLIVTNYLAIIGFHCCTNMINTSKQIELNMTTPLAVDNLSMEFDNSTLPAPDQANVVLFEALILANKMDITQEEI